MQPYSPIWAFTSIMNLLQTLDLSHVSVFLTGSFFTGWGCQPRAQPPTWRTRYHIYNPWDWVAQLYPRHWVPILVAFNDMHGLQWVYNGYLCICVCRYIINVLYIHIDVYNLCTVSNVHNIYYM